MLLKSTRVLMFSDVQGCVQSAHCGEGVRALWVLTGTADTAEESKAVAVTKDKSE
jgi:hypothetical protein